MVFNSEEKEWISIHSKELDKLSLEEIPNYLALNCKDGQFRSKILISIVYLYKLPIYERLVTFKSGETFGSLIAEFGNEEAKLGLATMLRLEERAEEWGLPKDIVKLFKGEKYVERR